MGLGVQALCCLVASCLQQYGDFGVTATSRPAAFLGLYADLGSDLQQPKPIVEKTQHRSLLGQSLFKSDFWKSDLSLLIRPGLTMSFVVLRK